jgi:hypothetical protein
MHAINLEGLTANKFRNQYLCGNFNRLKAFIKEGTKQTLQNINREKPTLKYWPAQTAEVQEAVV